MMLYFFDFFLGGGFDDCFVPSAASATDHISLHSALFSAITSKLNLSLFLPDRRIIHIVCTQSVIML